MERRKAPRVRCSVACQVRHRGGPVEGRVRNVSEGGLALEAPLGTPAEGDSLTVRLAPAGRPPFEIVALVWHVQAASSAGAPPLLGLVLAHAGEPYFEWLASLAGPGGAAPAPPAERQRFAVRVAQTEGARSRRILVVAADADAARDRALAEVGPGWRVAQIETLARR